MVNALCCRIELRWRLDGLVGQADHLAHFIDDYPHRRVAGLQHDDLIAQAVALRRAVKAQMQIRDRDHAATQDEKTNDPVRRFRRRRELGQPDGFAHPGRIQAEARAIKVKNQQRLGTHVASRAERFSVYA